MENRRRRRHFEGAGALVGVLLAAYSRKPFLAEVVAFRSIMVRQQQQPPQLVPSLVVTSSSSSSVSSRVRMSSRNNLDDDDDDNEDEERATRLQALQDKYLVGRPSFAASSSSSDRRFPPASARAPNKLDLYGADELSQLFELHQTLQPQNQEKKAEEAEDDDDDMLLPSSFRSGSKDKKKKKNATPIVPGRPELVPLSLHDLVRHTVATIDDEEDGGVVDRNGDRNGRNTGEATNTTRATPPPPAVDSVVATGPEAAAATLGRTITDEASRIEDSRTTNSTTSNDDDKNNPEDEGNRNRTASRLVPTLTGTEIEHLLTHWEEENTEETPLIIEAMASWCSPCQRLMPELVAAAQHFRCATTGTGTTTSQKAVVRFVQFDTDAEPALSDRLQIQGLPTLLFVTTEPSPQEHDPRPNTTTTTTTKSTTTKVAVKVRIEGGLRTESIIRLAEHHFFAGPKPESLHFL